MCNISQITFYRFLSVSIQEKIGNVASSHSIIEFWKISWKE